MSHLNVLAKGNRLLKVLAAIFAFVLLVGAALSLFACSDNEDTKPSGGGKPLRPPRYREGYTTEHKGEFTTADGTVQYDFTGTVHWITNEDTGFEIYGRIFKPADFDETKKYPMAIVCHGFNALSEDGTSRIVQNYIADGMLCYTFDFCGGGNSVQSDGETTDMSVESEILDLEYVVDYVQSLPYVDTGKIVLTGKSYGGLVVATEAARHPDEFAGLVLYFPAITAYKSFHEQWPDQASIDALPDDYTYTDEASKFTYGKKYYADFFALGDPLDYINDFDKDVILLQGNMDEAVSIDLQMETDKVYDEGAGQCTFVEVDGAPHNFSDANYLYVMPFVNDYLQSIGIIS